MKNISLLLFLLILSYSIGAIPFSVLVGKWFRGVNIQQVGSGNAGAMNTFRSVGRAAGVVVAVLDALKAAFVMLLGRLALDPQAAALCGAAAVAGHCFSPYLLYLSRTERNNGWKMLLRRSGGKGLASGVAVLLLIDWRLALATVAVFLVTRKLLWKDETWPSITAVGLTPLLVWMLTKDLLMTIAVLIVCAMVIIKHLPDVREGFYVQASNER